MVSKLLGCRNLELARTHVYTRQVSGLNAAHGGIETEGLLGFRLSATLNNRPPPYFATNTALPDPSLICPHEDLISFTVASGSGT